jgi:nucleotide-binding universal stress UspA family protein
MTAARAFAVPAFSPMAIKRILYAADFSPASRAALPIAAALARKYNSEIYLQNVRPVVPYVLSSPEALCTMENQRERDAQVEMRRLASSEELKGLPVASILEAGDPAEELTRTVRDLDIDLAVLGTHGHTGLMRLLMGSLAEELFRNLPCPVLTAGPHLGNRFQRPGPVKNIICATDLSPESRLVFPIAASIASQYGARMVVFHAIASEHARTIKARELAATKRKQIREMFGGEIDPRCNFEIVVDFGHPAERILSCARDYRADIIAFGVRHGSEATTHFRNTVAYRVVLESECPVLSLRSPKNDQEARNTR